MRSLLRYFVFLGVLLPASLWAGPQSVVTFNELMYHPAAPQTSGEWIELHNQHSVDVDLSGWRLDGGVDFVFPQGTTIKGAGYLVIAANPGVFQSATNTAAIGPFANVLSDDGETVTLKNKNGRVMDEIAYNDRFPWPIAADGSGATLAKINELGVSSDPRNWRASAGYGGTPMDYNFTPPVGGSVTAPSQAGIRRYFPFEGNAQDASGSNFHGTLQGGVGFSSETPAILGAGQSLDCDGVNDYVQIMDSQQPTAYTISAWVKPDTIRKQSIVVRGNTGGSAFAMANQIRMDATGHFEHSTSSVTVTGTTIAQVGQWYHVCTTAGNGGAVRLYVNGVQEGPTKPVTVLPTGNDRWLIGSNSFSSYTYFDGRIDDVAIWHTAFDAATVAAVKAGTLRPVDPAPVNVAFLKPVINASGHYPNLTFDQPPNGGNDFRAQHVTDGSDTDVYSGTYWLGREATPNEWFIVDLGAPQAIKQLLLRNTHNAIYNDRGTFTFRVFAASSVDGSNQLVTPVQILAGSLGSVANQTSIVAGAYTTQNGLAATTARYLKFESLTALNNNAGLNEFEVYTAFTGEPVTTSPHPPDVPLVINEVAAAGAAPFWVELQNYGGALPIGDYVIANETGAQFTIPAQTLASGGFVTFNAAQLGFTPLADEKLFLYTPARAVVLDAVKVKPRHQARRVATPPGEFLETTNPAEQTPGAVNNVALPTGIVINEIMYHHRPQYRDGAVPLAVNKEQWVELYNKSGAAVDVSGWKLDDAIGFTFPPGTSIPAGGFMVVADDLVTFNAAHPGVTALGPISGSLSNLGERLVLLDSLGNVVDEVNYRDGKPWPEFADGGGSSIELRNPNADNSVPEAWAASDETARSSWQNYTFTATAHTPVYTPNIYNFHELRLGLLDAGEVLIDDVSVIEDPGGPLNRELMQNGTFSTGTGAWRLLGNHETSGVVNDGGGSVLKIVASGASNYHPNLLETSLKAAGALVPVVENRNYKISFRAKWLRGSPQLHCELYYNKVAKTVMLAQPALSGTPGAQNSTFLANPGPTYKDVRHSPVISSALQAITVSGLLSDPQGVGSATLKYIVNGGPIGSVTMALGTDGRWAGAIPGQAASAVVQFWIEGRDGSNVLALWPAAGQSSRALIQVADNRASASKQNIRVTMTSADATALYTANDMMSNRHRGCTIVVNESEVFYDSEVRLHGSMFTRNAPSNGALNLYFPADHPYRGLNEKVRVRISGRNEIVVKHLINAASGLPENFNDSAWLVGPNNVGNTTVRVETTEFDDNYFDDDAADGTQGTSFKMEGIREYQTTVDGNPESRKSPWPQIGWVYAFDIADDGGTNPELYRHDFKFTSNRAQDDNSKIVAMCQAFSQPAGPAMDSAVDAAINADEWMRCFALESLCGIGDGYGFINGNPHNLNFYAPPAAGKVLAVPWDWSFAFYNPTDTPMLPSSHNISVVAARPIFGRLFWGHVRDLCQTVFNSSYMGSWLTHYSLHMGEDYSSYGTYIDARRASALAQLPSAVPFAITTNGGNPISVNGATTTLQGQGWIDVREIRINGSPEGLLVTWIDGTTWMVTIPVASGTNTVTLTAYDHNGVLVGTTTIVITGTGGTVPASPANLVITEVMYNPAANPDDEFIEVQNISAQTIDLTGCSFGTGIDYNFADAATLAPGARMTIPKPQFLNGTGLANNGERIILSAPGGAPIKDFTYVDAEPWPTSADGVGRSIVLIAPLTNPDPKNPFNWRPSAADGGNPGTSDAQSAPANPFGDSNGNGWPNLLEYAVKMPVTTQGFDVTGHLTFAFMRNLAADDAIYFVETSPDMLTWTGGAAVERINQANPVGATMVETWRTVALPGAGGKHFMRLRVQLRP
jgi:hypothetical protein